ncbi:NfeD family protein [Paenibacillus sinopodophylli]|uniref:NfeD family protein n=1 Tax=Paenibacillus sinopodophylli TaxID=1837342 RepID=UPI00110CA100|nr:NfeD family protein [Paenibacillus sinopodophylli]
MELWAIWLVLAGILLVVEMLTLTFYLLWLGVGAIVAAILDWIWPGSLVLQLLVASIIVLVLMVFTKPITRRFQLAAGFTDAVDELVGKHGIVLEEIGADSPGIVKVGNETWSALSTEKLTKGEAVVVISRGSAMLRVQKWGG